MNENDNFIGIIPTELENWDQRGQRLLEANA